MEGRQRRGAAPRNTGPRPALTSAVPAPARAPPQRPGPEGPFPPALGSSRLLRGAGAGAGAGGRPCAWSNVCQNVVASPPHPQPPFSWLTSTHSLEVDLE